MTCAPFNEVWKEIDGFDGYEVSDAGNVRCWNSQNGRGLKLTTPRSLKPSRFSGRPYFRVTLFRGGERTVRRLHHLVLEAFVGPCPEGMEACHGPLGGLNNTLRNLRWDTKLANMQDQITSGTRIRGSTCPLSKIDEEKAREIKAALSKDSGYGSIKRIAALTGVSYRTVTEIKYENSWRHV